MNDDEKRKQKTQSKEKYFLRANLFKAQESLKAASAQIAALTEENETLKRENEILRTSPDYSRALNDERFLESVFADERVKNRVIAEYLAALDRRSLAPVLRNSTGSTPLTPPKKPKSLEEAKRLAQLIINN